MIEEMLPADEIGTGDQVRMLVDESYGWHLVDGIIEDKYGLKAKVGKHIVALKAPFYKVRRFSDEVVTLRGPDGGVVERGSIGDLAQALVREMSKP